jgi:hypothetical protein
MSDTDWSFFDIPASAVQENLGVMSGRADAALATANTAIASSPAASVRPRAGDPHPPESRRHGARRPVPEIADYTRFGNPKDFNEPSFDDLWDSLDVERPVGRDRGVRAAQFPALVPARAVAFDATGLPDAPDHRAIDVPVAPTIVMPTMDALPTSRFPTSPSRRCRRSTTPRRRSMAWPRTPTWCGREPTYSSTVESDLVARVRAMLAGGTGLPANVQQALFDQARTHEAQTALEAEQGAFDSFAGKNFAMPPGMLVEAVRRAQEKSRLEQNAAAREQLAKAATWEIENLRNAVTQGMAYETLLRNYFNNTATRSFELAKFRVESDIKLYDAEVAIFNARNQQLATLAQVFKIRVDSVLDAFKTQLGALVEEAKLKGTLNEQAVRVLVARLDGVKQVVEIYKAKMQGAQTQAEVAKTVISGFAEDVRAYSAKVSAEKERWSAYSEQVRAAAEMGRSLEYEARAYEATVRGAEAKANIKKSYVDARIGALRESVAKFTSLVDAERSTVAASVQAMQANAAGFSADTQRYTAEIQGVNESVRTQLLTQQEHTKNQLALYEAALKEYDAKLMRMIEEAKITMAGLDAAARTSSTLAAGAMSAIHVQASMGAQGTASSQNSFSTTISRQGADVA